MMVSHINNVEDQLRSILDDRILILDGAMGSLIQSLKLDEAAVRGDRFADHSKDLKSVRFKVVKNVFFHVNVEEASKLIV